MIEVTIKVQALHPEDGYLHVEYTALTNTFVRCLPDNDFYGNKFNQGFNTSLYRFRGLLEGIVEHYAHSLPNQEYILTWAKAKELLDSCKEFSDMCEVTIRAI